MDGVTLRAVQPADIDWLTDLHAYLYARDEGFDQSFGPLVRSILYGFFEKHDPTCERGWIAQFGPDRLGSIFCVRGGAPGRAKLRLFLVHPSARGTGLGARLLQTCMEHAQDCGFKGMDLWTHESHRAACALYAKTGWKLTRSEPVHSFGQDLIEQSWSIDFPLARTQTKE